MTEQKSRLVIEISSEQAKKNAEDLSKELAKIYTQGEKADSTTEKFGKTIQVTSSITQNFNTTVNNTTKALADQNKQVNTNTDSVKELAKFVAGYISINKAIAAADGYTQMAARIRNATKGAQEYNFVQDRLLVTANTTFRAISEAQEVYLSLSGGMKSLGYNTKQTLDLSDSLSYSFTHNATRADQAQSAMDSLSKSMAKGKIDADAWISIVTGADNIIADMAKTTGKTEAEIRKLGANGKISLEDLIKTLVATREQNEKLANNMENSFKDGLQKLTNDATVFLGKLNETTKATGTLASGLAFLGEHVDKLAILGGIAASIYGGRLAAALVLSGQKAIWNAAAISTQAGAMGASTAAARSLYLALGGPIGLGIAVAGTVGSMLLFNNTTKNTTSTLDIQGNTVEQLVQKYSELDELQKRTTMRELEKEVSRLSTSYAVAYSDLNAYIGWLEDSGSVSEKTAKKVNALFKEYRLGGLSASEFATAINGLSGVQDKHKQKIDDLTTAQAKSKTEYEKVKTAQDALTKQTSAAVKANKDEAESIDAKRLAQEKLSALDKSYAQKNLDIDFSRINIKNHGLEMGKALAEFYDENKLSKTQKLSVEQWGIFQKNFSKQQELKNLENDITQAKKDQTKELEKQLKVLQVNEKVKANAAKYGFGGLEGKYGLPSGMLSAIHMIESRGNANAYNKGSGAGGGFQFLKSTGDQYGVKDRYNLAQSAEGAAKYLQYLLKLFNGNIEKAVRAYHAGEGNVQKGKNLGKYNNQYIKDYYGYMGGISGFTGESKDYKSLLNDQVKLLEKSQEEAEKIRKEFMSKGLQEEQEYKEQLKKIRENSTLSGDEKKTYEAQLTTRFEAQKKLNDLQQDYELNGYKYTESQKLQYTHDTNILRIDADSKYNDFQKALAKKAIDDQLAYELEKSKLAKDQRLLQSTEFYMSELQLAKAKYDIERRLLVESNDHPEEKAFKSQMLELQNQVDMNRRLKDASIGWDSVQSQMNGSTGRFQVSQDRFSRMGVSQNLFDTQIADVERQEQEPGADLQKLAEVREQIWAAHNKRMIDIENQYQTDSLNLQLTQAQQLTGSFANMFKGILGESSGAYKTMFAMQQGFALTQAGMNLWSSVSDAYAKEPGTVWQKVAAGAKAALDQGTFLAMIQAITPQGFATGGHITGKGTGTSDDIPIMASNGEFMMRQYAASKIGLVALNYMNQTGEIPFQREYLGMKSHYLGSTQPDLNVQKFKDGGLVGVSRINNADVERSQFDSIRQRNAGTNVPTINIYNSVSNKVEATASWDGKELTVIIEEIKKQNRAETQAMINKSWKMATSQGGVIDNLKRSR